MTEHAKQPASAVKDKPFRQHSVIYDDAFGHPGIDRCRNCNSNSVRDDWRKECTGNRVKPD